MSALKDLLDRKAVGRIGERLAKASPTFDAAAFRKQALRGLGKLELKARVRQIAHALRDHLDPDYERALGQIVASLPPALEDTEALSRDGFDHWPLCQLVEEYGADHVEASLDALHELTRRFSAEFAIRPLLVADEARTLRRIRRWLKDPNPHVRRLCSEGTRPRLPWGARLRAFQDDPEKVHFVLDRLVDDPELYVRRSVANHLGDVLKDHPEAAFATAARWASQRSEERDWVIRHALRAPLKAGDARALELVGLEPARISVVGFRVAPKRVALGGSVKIEAELVSRAKGAQALRIDYAVHFRKANGTQSPKVFRWKEISLPAGERVALEKRHAFRDLSTRRHHPGEHRVELRVNGSAVAEQTLRLTR